MALLEFKGFVKQAITVRAQQAVPHTRGHPASAEHDPKRQHERRRGCAEPHFRMRECRLRLETMLHFSAVQDTIPVKHKRYQPRSHLLSFSNSSRWRLRALPFGAQAVLPDSLYQ